MRGMRTKQCRFIDDREREWGREGEVRKRGKQRARIRGRGEHGLGLRKNLAVGDRITGGSEARRRF